MEWIDTEAIQREQQLAGWTRAQQAHQAECLVYQSLNDEMEYLWRDWQEVKDRRWLCSRSDAVSMEDDMLTLKANIWVSRDAMNVYDRDMQDYYCAIRGQYLDVD
jgi:hypothetical protein